MKNLKDATNMWDERYSGDGLAFGDQPNAFLRSQEPVIRAGGKRALCLGEGEGRNAVWLAQLGLDVTAVDLSSVGLKKASEWASRLGHPIHTVQADLGEWQFEAARWDLIVSIFCHLPPEVRARAYRGVVSALAPDGLFIAESYAPSQISRGTGGPSDVRLLPSAEQLRIELDGLHFVELRETTRDVVEGRFHTGVADVVQIVGQKRA